MCTSLGAFHMQGRAYSAWREGTRAFGNPFPQALLELVHLPREGLQTFQVVGIVLQTGAGIGGPGRQQMAARRGVR